MTLREAREVHAAHRAELERQAAERKRKRRWDLVTVVVLVAVAGGLLALALGWWQ